MEKMKAGIIGCGNISAIYLENLKNNPVIEVVAVADLIRERAQERADEFNIANVYNVDELLQNNEIELVLNLTVPGSHAMTDLAALEAGKHVYAEKPLAISLEDGRKVVELAEEKGLYVGSAPDTFLGSGIQTARKAIEDGLIGRSRLQRLHSSWVEDQRLGILIRSSFMSQVADRCLIWDLTT